MCNSYSINTQRKYSTYSSSTLNNSSLSSTSDSSSLPVPISVLNELDNTSSVLSYSETLRKKAGIYCLVNTINNKRYIGSAKDLYLRLIEHLSNKKSNIALQNAINKYGLDKFSFCIYEYFTYHSKVVSHKALTDLETSYIKKYPFDSLYNFMITATSIAGYKHTDEAKLKLRGMKPSLIIQCMVKSTELSHWL